MSCRNAMPCRCARDRPAHAIPADHRLKVAKTASHLDLIRDQELNRSLHQRTPATGYAPSE